MYFSVNESVRVNPSSNCSLFSPPVTVGTLQLNVKKKSSRQVPKYSDLLKENCGFRTSSFPFFVDCAVMANLPPFLDV